MVQACAMRRARMESYGVASRAALRWHKPSAALSRNPSVSGYIKPSLLSRIHRTLPMSLIGIYLMGTYVNSFIHILDVYSSYGYIAPPWRRWSRFWASVVNDADTNGCLAIKRRSPKYVRTARVRIGIDRDSPTQRQAKERLAANGTCEPQHSCSAPN
jgi:hypothetical protein